MKHVDRTHLYEIWLSSVNLPTKILGPIGSAVLMLIINF